jgi:photosystem II stability/assembly factor-like uncharacterized protein
MNRQRIVYFALGVLAITALFLGGCAGQETVTVTVPQGATSTPVTPSSKAPTTTQKPLLSPSRISPNYPSTSALVPPSFPTFTAAGVLQVTWVPVGQIDPLDPGHANGLYPLGLFLSPAYAIDHTLYAYILPVFDKTGLQVGGLFRSTDKGASWQGASQGLTGQFGAYSQSLVLSPAYSTDHTLFVGTQGEGSGVFRSSDGGATWKNLSQGLPSHLIKDPQSWEDVPSYEVLVLALSPAYTTDHTIYAGTFAGLFRSTDAGATWQVANKGLPYPTVTQLSLSPAYPSDHTLYAYSAGSSAYGGGGLFRSVDAGVTWQAANKGLPYPEVKALAISPAYAIDHTLYAGTQGADSGVFRSVDGGENWQAVNPMPNANVSALALSPAFAKDHTLYAGVESGIEGSTDGGATWQAENEGLSGLGVVCLVLSPAYASDHTLYVSNNGVSLSKIYRGVVK